MHAPGCAIVQGFLWIVVGIKVGEELSASQWRVMIMSSFEMIQLPRIDFSRIQFQLGTLLTLGE